MRRNQAFAILAILVVLPAAGPALGGQTFVETFDGGSNEGGWTWGTPGGSIPPAGGNPGAYLDSGLLDTFAPQPRTSLVGSMFTGNFRDRQVSAIGVDLVTFAQATTGGRPLTLMLIHDNQTPGDTSDDSAAYFLGPNIPHFGQGWLAYDFPVPSQETSLPAGWLLLNLGNIDDPAIHTWDQIVQDVDQLRFHYGDPTFFFIFQQWFLGLDNARITESACESSAGAVPDGADVPGTMLTLRKALGTGVRLFWGASCNGCDSDFGVYEGPLGDYDAHVAIGCSTGGIQATIVSPAAGDRYFLVVPSNGRNEGSYGRAGDGTERAIGLDACHPQAFEPCQ